MATDLDKIPPHILKVVIEALIDRTYSIKCELDARKELQFMSVSEIFEFWLNWNGIIGYTDSIIAAYEGIKASKEQNHG